MCYVQEKGGYFQIDIAKVHLMYILQNKIKINWPNYFVSRMFVVKDYNRGSCLCCFSMIMKILRNFRISVVNLQNISLNQDQEFNSGTMRHMRYHWDNDLKVYYYKMKGSGKVIYNYDDTTEFGICNVDE